MTTSGETKILRASVMNWTSVSVSVAPAATGPIKGKGGCDMAFASGGKRPMFSKTVSAVERFGPLCRAKLSSRSVSPKLRLRSLVFALFSRRLYVCRAFSVALFKMHSHFVHLQIATPSFLT